MEIHNFGVYMVAKAYASPIRRHNPFLNARGGLEELGSSKLQALRMANPSRPDHLQNMNGQIVGVVSFAIRKTKPRSVFFSIAGTQYVFGI
jgi:hypothetical protein